MHNPNAKMGIGVKMKLRKVDHDKAKKAYQTEVESIMKAAQIHIVVATLIMTDTFVTGITLPGGFESESDNPNQGMAILTRNTIFRAFVVSDVIAFTFSLVSIFVYFLMEDTSRDPQSKKVVKKIYDLAVSSIHNNAGVILGLLPRNGSCHRGMRHGGPCLPLE
ncbi:hypothetical protein P3S67_006545 [Capsicum chacoense]